MAYYLKTFDMALMEIARSLIAQLGPSVDLVEGSVIRSLAEAVAFQAADLSERQERSILAAIPDSTYTAFGFDRIPAQAASGTLHFYTAIPARDAIYVPAGAEAISDEEQVYVTTQDAYIAPGEIGVEVPAQAQWAGAAGNTGALTITRLGGGIPSVQGVANPVPFTGGADEESDDERQSRFAQYIMSLDRSNPRGLEGAVLQATAEGIHANDVLIRDSDTDPNIAPAFVHIHAYRRGGLPEPLQYAIRKAVNLARAGGVIPLFIWTPGTPVDLTIVAVCPDLTAQLQATEAVRQATSNYFAALRYGQKASYENLITRATTAHASITEVSVVTPTGTDVFCAPTEHLELGQLTVSVVSA